MLEVDANPLVFFSKGPDGELDISFSLPPLPLCQVDACWVLAVCTVTRPLKVAVSRALDAVATGEIFLWAVICLIKSQKPLFFISYLL